MFKLWAFLALARIGCLANELGQQPIADLLTPAPEYAHQALSVDPLSEPGPHSIVIPLFTEVTSTTEAEHASIHILITTSASSPKTAFDTAQSREAEISSLIQSMSRNSSLIKHHSNSLHRLISEHEFEPALPSGEEVKEDRPAHASVRLTARFTDLGALSRFASTIFQDSNYSDISIRSLEWTLTPDAQFDVLHKLRYEAMKELHVAAKEYVKVYGVEVLAVQSYSDSFRMLGAYDGESETRLDFDDADEIRGFFAEEDEVKGEKKKMKVGAVRIALAAQCEFLTQKE